MRACAPIVLAVALAGACRGGEICAPRACDGQRVGAIPDGCGSWVFCGSDPNVDPVDPAASASARAVLRFLADLPNRPDRRVVSGQRAFAYPTEWDAIRSATGHTPGVLGGAYDCYVAKGCAGSPKPRFEIATLVEHWNRGGLVQMSELLGNPKTGGGSIDTSFDTNDFERLLTPGDPIERAFLAQLDVVAEGYAALEREGVVVLQHGLPEMNGDWFWWSRGTPAQYKRLWQLELDYLTKTKGLHNLLFIYAPNEGFGGYGTFYPGDASVDIVGLDFYLDVEGPIRKADGYDELIAIVAPAKPFGLIEFGPLPGGRTTLDHPHDYAELISTIKRSMPKTSYWHSWNKVYGMGIIDPKAGTTHLHVAELLSDPWVMNLGDFSIR